MKNIPLTTKRENYNTLEEWILSLLPREKGEDLVPLDPNEEPLQASPLRKKKRKGQAITSVSKNVKVQVFQDALFKKAYDILHLPDSIFSLVLNKSDSYKLEYICKFSYSPVVAKINSVFEYEFWAVQVPNFFPRFELAEHLLKFPLEKIHCGYKDMGCDTVTCPRSQMDAHLRDMCQRHMELALKFTQSSLHLPRNVMN